MKLALVAISKHGKELGQRIKEKFSPEIDFFLQENLFVSGEEVIPFPRGGLSSLFKHLFVDYEGIICLMALGIVVRKIAPYIEDKRYDPAVVVLDEKGESVISVLSGHIGGANQLTRDLAKALGSRPVITTATDLHEQMALDLLAQEIGCEIKPFSNLKKISGAVVNGQKVAIYSQYPLPLEKTKDTPVYNLEEYRPEGEEEAVVLVTNQDLPKPSKKPYAFLRPKNIAMGVGCRRGTTKEAILQAIEKALTQSGLSKESLAYLTSIELKKDEIGILEAAQELKVPLKFFSQEEINQVEGEYAKSTFVQEKIGVNGVCEQTAILALKRPRLVVPKTVFVPAVTVAVAEEQSL